jgi:hypothetical protein
MTDVTTTLDVAVHAATKALEGAYDWDGYDVAGVARIAVSAAAPHLPAAGALQWYSDTLHKTDGERMAAEAELEATRSRLKRLEVHAAELRCEPCEDCYERCCGTQEEPCRCHRAAAVEREP